MFNVQALLGALNAGASLVDEAAGLFGPEAQKVADAGKAIVTSATAAYQQVKPVLSATDTATVDAALVAAHDKAGTDLDRVLAELQAVEGSS